MSNIFRVVVVFSLFALASRILYADIRDDVHIQSDNDTVRSDIDSRTFNEVKSFYDRGYPPASVMLHGVSLGMAIDDLVYLAVKSDVERSQEFYDTAMSILPSLPSWACRSSSADSARYGQGYDASELGEQPTLQAVADRFFNDNQRMIPFPNWKEKGVHMQVSTDELISKLKEQWWYQANTASPASTSLDRPIMVGLYKHNNEILIDTNLDLVAKAKAQGITELGVVIVYNEEDERPVSEFGDEATISDVAGKFHGDNLRATSVPEWQVGDYHIMAKLDEIKDKFQIPVRKDIEPQRWETISNDIKENGFTKPLMVTLLSNDNGAWLDDRERVAVAASLGMTELPTVFFYHSFDRLACGAAPTCEDYICEAAIAAGANSSMCTPGSTQTSPPVPPPPLLPPPSTPSPAGVQ
ncbi:hypothetical protein ACFL17_02155 [Pseudomonadota bacterium]